VTTKISYQLAMAADSVHQEYVYHQYMGWPVKMLVFFEQHLKGDLVEILK
jgi:hypothetical protein